jgi:hypothetical protein
MQVAIYMPARTLNNILKFIHGYPISVSNLEGDVIIYQQCFDDFLFYKVEGKDEIDEFITHFRHDVNFRFKEDDTSIFYPHDDYFIDAIEREIDQLFIPEPKGYGKVKI